MTPETCRACIYDSLAAGSWLEQVAACDQRACALYRVRPLPANCLMEGEEHRPSVDALRRRLLNRNVRRGYTPRAPTGFTSG